MTGGIYVIIAGDKIIYVGKTTRTFKARFKEHKRAVEGKAKQYPIHLLIKEYKEQGIPVSLLAIYTATGNENLNALEKEYIQLFRPIGNIVGKSAK